ncbi:MAG: hypothetical protein HY901_04675 [Deltaproteobacteria bacterium]|nr:hypothetical protein [Deltaproteobacteria bacterium]
MIQLDESRLRFEFGESWMVVRYDKSSSFRSISVLNGELWDGDAPRNQGTKAVDFVAVREGALFLIEVKNFEGHERGTRLRLERELDLEIGLKVRDTVAGLVGGVRSGMLPEPLASAVARVADDGQKVHVVGWIERDDPPPSKRWMTIGDDPVEDRIKQRLRWLKPKVLLCSRERPGLVDVDVTRLARD